MRVRTRTRMRVRASVCACMRLCVRAYLVRRVSRVSFLGCAPFLHNQLPFFVSDNDVMISCFQSVPMIATTRAVGTGLGMAHSDELLDRAEGDERRAADDCFDSLSAPDASPASRRGPDAPLPPAGMLICMLDMYVLYDGCI